MEEYFLGINATNECYNGCSFCQHAKSLDPASFQFDKIYDKIKHFKYFSIGGGEPLLNPNLEGLLDKIKESSESIKYVSIMTSGITPKAPAEKIKIFYDNMKKVAGVASENLFINFIFSYSDGLDPEARLKNFCEKYNEININTHLVFNIITQNKINKKSRELKKAIKSYKIDCKLNNKIKPIDFSLNENMELLKEVPCFCRKNDFLADINGDLYLCNKPYSKKIIYANIINDSFDEILAKKQALAESFIEFFKEKGNNCYNCITGFSLEKIAGSEI
ncbi:MAG: radical SAM protein [Candidatus Nanoarchaeia archaeon]|jgi:organic radical activating enzyme